MEPVAEHAETGSTRKDRRLEKIHLRLMGLDQYCTEKLVCGIY